MEDNLNDASTDESKMNKNEKTNLIDKENPKDGLIGIQPSKLKIFNIFELIFAYISLFMLNNPKKSFFLIFVNLVAVVLIINANVKNAPDVSKIIVHDYSGIKSKYDLHVGAIDHWCLGGGDGDCHCEDPLTPSKKQSQIWSKAVDENWYDIKEAINFWGEEKGSIDVVFLGANIVEYWKGRTIGRTTSAFAEEVSHKFKKVFEKGKIKALPLGIAGDTVSNILWRLQNGELPDYLRPKIWWLVIGDNDIALRQCSEEVVLVGILRIVEEILDKIPDAKIVINSILPMTSNENGYTPNIKFSKVKKLSAHLDGSDTEVKSDTNVRRRLKGDDDDNDDEDDNDNDNEDDNDNGDEDDNDNGDEDDNDDDDDDTDGKDDNGDGDDEGENIGEDKKQDEESKEKIWVPNEEQEKKEEKRKKWKIWVPSEEQKKKWSLKWGKGKKKKQDKDGNDKKSKKGEGKNDKKPEKDEGKGDKKPKKKWTKKLSGKKDDEKKSVDDEIGNEAQLTSASGEMKPAKGSEKISFWHSVVAINVALSKFCWKNKQVTFFDASDIFIEDRKLITELMLSPSSAQPSVAGHGELLLAIEQKVKDLLHADVKKERKHKKASIHEDDDEY